MGSWTTSTADNLEVEVDATGLTHSAAMYLGRVFKKQRMLHTSHGG